MTGSDKYARPSIGFSPGFGLADLAFTIVYRLYLIAVQARLNRQGYAPHIHVPSDAAFPDRDGYGCTTDDTSVDDNVFMVPYDNAMDTVEVAKSVSKIVLSEFGIRGFMPNMKLGETTIVPLLLGPGSKDSFTSVFVDHSAKISVADDYNNQYDWCFAMSYKHLGSHKDCKRSPVLETNFRIGQCITAMKKLSKPLWKSLLLPPQKWSFCSSLAVTKLTFDSWTDGRIIKSTYLKLEATYNGIARRCTVGCPQFLHLQ